MSDRDHKPSRGFAGLASLVSEVAPVIQDARRKMAEALPSSSQSRPNEREPYPNGSPVPTGPPPRADQPRLIGGSRAGEKRFAAIVTAVVVLFLLFLSSMYGGKHARQEPTSPDASDPSSNAEPDPLLQAEREVALGEAQRASSLRSVPNAGEEDPLEKWNRILAPQKAQRANLARSLPKAAQEDPMKQWARKYPQAGAAVQNSSDPASGWSRGDPTEVRPQMGGAERILTNAEIRYCLAEVIRLTGAEAVVNRHRRLQIDEFNGDVDDYNSRCGRYKYKAGSLESARRDIETQRARFLREGRRRFADDGRPTSSIGRTGGSSIAIRSLLPSNAVDAQSYTEASLSPANGALSARERSEVSPQDNLSTCMLGYFPTLCDHSKLTSSQAVNVAAAERRDNYVTCISGDYPALCHHDLLNASQAWAVDAAERRSNFHTCSSGMYPALCRHDLLTVEQATTVRGAEGRVNYGTCISGLNPALCNHATLSPVEAQDVRASERTVSRP